MRAGTADRQAAVDGLTRHFTEGRLNPNEFDERVGTAYAAIYLDELPEFSRRTLEVMRQPLEDGVVTISRALNSTTFPAEFMLVAALNPCPCGYKNDPRRDCNCSVPQIERYMAKISGPLIDRIDIHMEVPAVPYKELSADRAGTSSQSMREQVIAARAIQAAAEQVFQEAR